MVSALALCVPVYVIGWSHKYAEVLKMFDLERNMIDFAQADSTTISESILTLLANQKEVKQKLESHLPAVKKSAASQFE